MRIRNKVLNVLTELAIQEGSEESLEMLRKELSYDYRMIFSVSQEYLTRVDDFALRRFVGHVEQVADKVKDKENPEEVVAYIKKWIIEMEEDDFAWWRNNQIDEDDDLKQEDIDDFPENFTLQKKFGRTIRDIPHFLFTFTLNDTKLIEFAMKKAKLKLEGNEHRKRRPSVGSSFHHTNDILVIKPELQSSPMGWELTGEVRIYPTITRKRYYLIYNNQVVKGNKKYIFPSVKKFMDLYSVVGLLSEVMKSPSVFQSGFCMWCDREISSDESLLRGIGSHCRKKHGDFIEVFEKWMEAEFLTK